MSGRSGEHDHPGDNGTTVTGLGKRSAILCRTCLRPLTWETRTEPGFLPRTGFYDDARSDPLVCFKAIDYQHKPLTDREWAYYEAGQRSVTMPPGLRTDGDDTAPPERPEPPERPRLEPLPDPVVPDIRESPQPEQRPGRVETRGDCGGCKGLGSHGRYCPRHPAYHPWRRLADMAEGIGDSLGEPALANRAWSLAAAIRDGIADKPYRRAHANQEDA